MSNIRDIQNTMQEFQPRKNAVLVLSDGFFFEGYGCGTFGEIGGEICFNTAMTGYQEVVTDLSYAGQIICFTAPHIGNVGANSVDVENIFDRSEDRTKYDNVPFAKGIVMRNKPTNTANFRGDMPWDAWLKKHEIVAIYGIDTRFLAAHIRNKGMLNAFLYHSESYDRSCLPVLLEKASLLPYMQGQELTHKVMTQQAYTSPTYDNKKTDFASQYIAHRKNQLSIKEKSDNLHIVVIDFGAKLNIIAMLSSYAYICVTVMPAQSDIQTILAHDADGYILSNGPGDPNETIRYAKDTICALINTHKPVYGVCLGHQLLALTLGMKTKKMRHGHHGVNHPVYNTEADNVKICSMNHGFCVDMETKPETIIETHYSLFDKTNCGLRVKDKPIYSVQYHPEASPGPHDTSDFFTEFVEDVQRCKITSNLSRAIS